MFRPNQALKAQVNYMSQISMVSYSCYKASLPACKHGHMGFSLWSVGRERKYSSLVHKWFCVICMPHPKMDSCRTTAQSRVPLKNSGERKSSQGKNFKHCIWMFTFLERINGLMWHYILIHGLWLIVWMDGQGIRRKIIGKFLIRFLGRDIWIDPLSEQTNMRIFLSNVNVHKRLTPTK